MVCDLKNCSREILKSLVLEFPVFWRFPDSNQISFRTKLSVFILGLSKNSAESELALMVLVDRVERKGLTECRSEAHQT